MVSKICLENFRSFDAIEFDLCKNRTDKRAKNLAIIYGENSIGKTSIVNALKFLSESFTSLTQLKTFEKSIINLKDIEDIKSILGQQLDQFKISSFLKSSKKIGSKNNMFMRYEGFIDKNKYLYELEFDNHQLLKEKLFFNGEKCFKIDKLNNIFDVSDKHFFSQTFNSDIKSIFEMYFGDYTFLSCVDFTAKNTVKNFFDKAFSSIFISFMSELESMIVFKTGINTNSVSIKNNPFLKNLISGVIKDENDLFKTQDALSMYFSSLYSNIKRVSYHVSQHEDGKKTYSLFFVEKSINGDIEIPFELASTGTKNMLVLFNVLYNVCSSKRVVVIDEIDTGINDILLKNVFESVSESLKGQLIVTTHNTLLLKNSIKNSVYLLDRDNDKVNIYSLDSFGRKIQAGTDIIGQYLKGLYGGIPQQGYFSIKYIVEFMKNYGK